MVEGTIETDRLILRPAAAGDLSWTLKSINTPGMMRHLGGEPRSAEAVRESLNADIAAFDNPGGHQRWTAWYNDEQVTVWSVTAEDWSARRG